MKSPGKGVYGSDILVFCFGSCDCLLTFEKNIIVSFDLGSVFVYSSSEITNTVGIYEYNMNVD